MHTAICKWDFLPFKRLIHEWEYDDRLHTIEGWFGGIKVRQQQYDDGLHTIEGCLCGKKVRQQQSTRVKTTAITIATTRATIS